MPAFEAIASSTLTSASGSVTFSSIPGTYEHLQLRAYCRLDLTAGTAQVVGIRFNSDSGSNYSYHSHESNGTNISLLSAANNTRILVGRVPDDGTTANCFGTVVIDILDYASTNKYKTVRSLNGEDRTTAGTVGQFSGLWMSTSAITTIEFGRTPAGSGNMMAGSVVSLYGLRSA